MKSEEEKLRNYLVGVVMKEFNYRPDPKRVWELIKEKLDKEVKK